MNDDKHLPQRDDPLDNHNVFSPYKILSYPVVLEAAQQDKKLDPINIEINPTNTCNQSCSWCTYGYLHDRKEQLPTENIIKLLDDAKELGVKSVTWTGGGEPTVYKNLLTVVQHARDLGFSQGINSNGTNMPEALRKVICESFDYIRFSVDAGNPAIYSKTHRVKPESFERVISNIRAICADRTKIGNPLVVGYSFLVDHTNVSNLAEGARLAREIGVDYFQVKPIVNYDDSNAQFNESSDMWKTLSEQIDQCKDLPSDSFELRILGHKFSDIQKQQEGYGRSYSQCRGNELLATVGADGSVDVCCAYKGHADWSFGNIVDSRFKDVWAGKQRRDVLDKIDVKRCPPLCKAHEINKLLHYVKNVKKHRHFV